MGIEGTPVFESHCRHDPPGFGDLRGSAIHLRQQAVGRVLTSRHLQMLVEKRANYTFNNRATLNGGCLIEKRAEFFLGGM
jgi:hypothetical protein